MFPLKNKEKKIIVWEPIDATDGLVDEQELRRSKQNLEGKEFR